VRRTIELQLENHLTSAKVGPSLTFRQLRIALSESIWCSIPKKCNEPSCDKIIALGQLSGATWHSDRESLPAPRWMSRKARPGMGK
jgi:hypothetical protein